MTGGDLGIVCALAQAGGTFSRTAVPAISDGRLASLIDAGLVTKEGHAEEIVCLQCDEPHPMGVEWEPGSQRYRGFCADAGFVDLPKDDVALFAVDRDWFSSALRQFLALRGANEDSLIARHAWYLGTAVTNRIDWNVILLVGLDPVDAVEVLLMRARTLPTATVSLVLTTSAEIDGQLLAPHNIWFLRLHDVASLEFGPSARLTVDKERLAARLLGFAKGSTAPKRSAGGSPGRNPRFVDQIITDRRSRGIALANNSAEARAIVEEFKSLFPDHDPPAPNTVRNKLM